ncbi:MAG TPA: hypothetical protein V6C88_12620 [Chroococcidiopsis sp.]
MCVSTAVFCTLATLAAKEGAPTGVSPPPALEPPGQENLSPKAIAPRMRDAAVNSVTVDPVTVDSVTVDSGTAPEGLNSPVSQVRAHSQRLALRSALGSGGSLTAKPSPAPVGDRPQVDSPLASIPALHEVLTLPHGNGVAGDGMASPDWQTATHYPTPEPMVMPEGSRRSRSEMVLDAIAARRDTVAVASPEVVTHSAVEAAPSTQATDLMLAQATTPPPSEEELQELQQQLENLTPEDDYGDELADSPAITLAIPSGYGADNFTGFVNFSYQSRTRFSNQDDGTMGVGIGFGDAQESVGVQLSYTVASFGTNRDFGSGGFNAKVHRQLPGGWSIAAGWEGFLNIGDENDFEDSIYGSVTHIIRTTPDIDSPLSRIALTAGVGSGRFRTEEAIFDDDNTVGVFGSIALRLARPVSAIVEWTGQDLAAGLSIAPIRNFPLVITPALRDIAGAGDGARFVLGAGLSFQF